MRLLSWASPLLFAFAYLLHSYLQEMHLISPAQLLRLTIVLWVALSLLYCLIYLLLKSWAWASALLTILVFGFCFSQYFFSLAGSVVVLIMSLFLIYFKLRGWQITTTKILLLLNGIALSIIVLTLNPITRTFRGVPWNLYQKSVSQARNYSVDLAASPSRPDIYYIILDGYVRSDVLLELYQYDNSPFVTYLESRGFIVPRDIHSNYAKTALSVPSTLNMEYLDSFSPGLEDSYFWWLMKPFIDHSRVRAVLQDLGYRTFSVSSDWSLTDNRTVDLRLDPYPIMLTDFEKYFVDHTPFRYLTSSLESFASVSTYTSHRTIVRRTFEMLSKIPASPGPKFVFVHIISPHPPFVFDRRGNAIDPSYVFAYHDANDFPGTAAEYRKGYIEQVEFVNRQMQMVIEAILKESDTLPIILIQSDHGSGLLTSFGSAEKTCLRERYSPFAAYYLPGLGEDVIPSDITPVNLFRIIFNQYFQADFPMLENKQFFSPGVYLYRLTEVTSRVDEACRVDE